MRRMVLIAMVMVMAAATSAMAQQIDLKFLDQFEAKASSTTRIDMDEATLKSAAGVLNDQDSAEAAAKKSVQGMKAFHLRVFEFEKPGMFKVDDLKPLRDQLKAGGWTTFLQHKESDELTEIWIHRTNGQSDGMLLLAAEPDEVSVIYCFGTVSLQDLVNVGGRLGAPQILEEGK